MLTSISPTGETERGLMFIGWVICHDMPRSQTSSPHLSSPVAKDVFPCFSTISNEANSGGH